MNMFTFTSNFCGLLFWGILAIVYFSKRNMSNIENKIYKSQIIVDFFVLSTSMVCLVVANFIKGYDVYFYIYDIFARLFCVSEVLWAILLAYYTVVVIAQEQKGKLHHILYESKKFNYLLFSIIFIILLIVGMLPVTYIFIGKENVIAYYGVRSDFITYLLGTIGICCLIVIIANSKYVNRKKAFPFLLFVVLELFALFLNMFDKTINIYTLSITLISYFMYHTIENPDISLINQLELAKNQAEKSNEAKTDFLSSMSHEIRTPLNAIVGLSQMISEGTNIEDMRRDSKDVLIASQNLLEIVNGILDINRLEANKMEIINSNYNLREEIDHLIKMIKIRIDDKPIDLRVKYDERIPNNLYGDKDKIKQILTNLLTNAVKYTDEGIVELKVECKNNKEVCELIFSVKDTGRGMKKEMIPHLFTKFNRLEEDKDTDIEGTGLGLAITKSLVELLNGKIEVESTYGVGSLFTVTIPQLIEENN